MYAIGGLQTVVPAKNFSLKLGTYIFKNDFPRVLS